MQKLYTFYALSTLKTVFIGNMVIGYMTSSACGLVRYYVLFLKLIFRQCLQSISSASFALYIDLIKSMKSGSISVTEIPNYSSHLIICIGFAIFM